MSRRPATPVTAGQPPVRLSFEAAARLDALFREYNGFVVWLAAVQLGDDDRAQDLAQGVWLSVIPLLARGEAITRPRAFLATVVRRRAIDYRRSAVVRSEKPADWSDDLAARVLPSAPPADVDAVALGGLSAHQAAVVKLAAQGFSQSAIARRMGGSRGAVYSHLHRGARKLRLAGQVLPGGAA
ncbi:MAG: RNA polymerase sigma factor [Catenulispora sp.]